VFITRAKSGSALSTVRARKDIGPMEMNRYAKKTDVV